MFISLGTRREYFQNSMSSSFFRHSRPCGVALLTRSDAYVWTLTNIFLCTFLGENVERCSCAIGEINIIYLSTNLYASLWFPVCQSMRHNAKADKKYDTSAETRVCGAVPGVGFTLIASVFCS